MASSQTQTNPSPRPAHTAGPSTVSSSTTSPTGTHSTVATTIGNPRQRSWDEDKSLNLYILDYCRRRNFEETALAFEREAKIPRDATTRFNAPQGLLFEWWIVFWETFNSQMTQLSARESPGNSQSDSPGQVYVNTMARLKKLAMHEKEEVTRSRGVSMNMGIGTPAMNNTSMPAPGMTGNMSAPGINGGMRPPSQASTRSQSQQPGMPPAPGPQQMRQPQHGMVGMHMTPTMAHTPTHTASTPTPAPAPSPSPAPTPPQSFGGPGSGPGPSQQPFNPGSGQPPFGGPGPQPSGPPPPSGQPGGPTGGQQPMMHQGYQHPPGPGQPPFPGSGPGQFAGGPGGGPGQFGPGGGGGAASGPGPSGSFPPGGPTGSFPPPGGFQHGSGPSSGGPGPGQFPTNGPGTAGQNFPPGGSGNFQSGAPFSGPGQQFNPRAIPEWATRPAPPGADGQQREPWQNGRPGPGPAGPGVMMQQKPLIPGGQSMPPQMRGQGGMPGRFPGQHGMPGGPPPHMGGPPNNMMGGPPGGPQQQIGQSPKEGSRSNTPATGWNPAGDPLQQRRPAVAAQGGQTGPSAPHGRPFMGPGGMGPQGAGGMSGPPGPGMAPGMGGPGNMGGPGQAGMGPQGQGGMGPQGQGNLGQKRPGSPPPPPTNLGASPPDAKRPRPNDPGPATLADSRPPSSEGGMQFGAGGPPQPMHGGPGGGHPNMMNGQPPQGLQDYKQEITAITRQAIVKQGVQPPPFGKPNGGQASEPRQMTNVKNSAAGSMGPPASPSFANRGVVVVKKSESANSSPALASNTVQNGMTGDRSRTPSSNMGKMPSPRPGPATRPQSATPTANNAGTPGNPPPPPPNSAPPLMGQSPSNGMPYPRPGSELGQDGAMSGAFDFGPEIDFSQLTSEFLPEDLGLFSLNDWPNEPPMGS